MAFRLEMHRGEARDVIEHRRDERPDHHLAIGDRKELSHDEGGGAHDRRHDLAAGRGHRLHAGSEMRLESRCASSTESQIGPSTITLATALPEIVPNRLDDTTETLPGPPAVCPVSDSAKSMKSWPVPVRSMNEPNSTKIIT
jgi:hypothetical protein